MSIDNQNNYSQFSYLDFNSEEAMVQGADTNPVIVNYFTANGQFAASSQEVIGGSKNPGPPGITGGKIAGFIELRDVLLPASLNAIGTLGNLVANTVNAVHNNGSPFPPKTTYTSANQFSLSSATNWSGTTT